MRNKVIYMADNERINDAGRENVVYIGKKPTMNYVLAVVTQFNSGMPEVTIKARGNAISRAVDVKEIVQNKFLPGLKEKSIKTSSEEISNEDGTKSKVSAIQIVLMK
ncbi:Af1 [Candidatus Micrarchaeum sp.]|jgi:DNA-binding protein|nr:Af1 [Candidatus Micrarchaeum sp.]